MPKSSSIKETVFWLAYSGLFELLLSPFSPNGLSFAIPGMILGIINLILAFSCWNQKKTGFLVAIALSLIVAVAAFPYPPLYPNESPFGDLVDAAVILPALLIIFFAHRAYKELQQEKVSKSGST